MTLTIEATPTAEFSEDTSWPEEPEVGAEVPNPMQEFAALLAQSYALTPLFA